MLTLAALVVAHPVAAQRIESLTLPPAVETHPHEFTGITSLRELSDGRVIVTDGAEQRILVLDFANQTAKETGREGQGPEEYGLVHFVYDIGADSSFMVDMPGMRFLLFNGDSIVETVPPDDPAAEASGGVITGADRLGHIIQWRTPRGAPGVTITGKDDSSTVVRISRLLGQITLPANEEIVGAGEQTIYIAYKDEVDIERIRRHTWTVTRGDRD